MRDVTIRELTAADEAALASWAADDELTRDLPFGPGREVKAWISSAMADAAATPRTVWTLAVDAGRDRAAGLVVVSIDSRHDARAEIGFAVRTDRRGRGIASAAVGLLVDMAFRDLRLHRLWAVCHPDNGGSRRVLERNGFELEGRLQGDRRTAGGWSDSLLFGLVAGGTGD